MPPYLADWQNAKKTFETATGKKKPSEKVLGAFRKSTKIESALKGVDACVKKDKWDDLPSAHKEFVKASNDYQSTLRKMVKQDTTGSDYIKEVDKLENSLETIRKAILNLVQTSGDISQASPKEIIGKSAYGLLTKGLAADKKVTSWIKDSKNFVNLASGAADPKAAKFQTEATKAFKEYQTALNNMKSTGDAVDDRNKVVKWIAQELGKMWDGVGTNGLQKAITEWMDYQGQEWKKAKKPGKVTDTSAAKDAMKIGRILEAEVVNLNKVESIVDKLRF